MARVPFLKRDDLAETDRGGLRSASKNRAAASASSGRPCSTRRTSPTAFSRLRTNCGMAPLIDKRTRELAVLVVGQVTKCAYEFDHHWNAALKAGIPREHLEALGEFETSPLVYRTRSRGDAVCEEITLTGAVADATWDALRALLRHPAGHGNSAHRRLVQHGGAHSVAAGHSQRAGFQAAVTAMATATRTDAVFHGRYRMCHDAGNKNHYRPDGRS